MIFMINIMSGSNALAAAKRRRVDGSSKPVAPVARPNNSQQRPQPQPQSQNRAQPNVRTQPNQPSLRTQPPNNNRPIDPRQVNRPIDPRQVNRPNAVVDRNQFSAQANNVEQTNNVFIIPQPPQGVNPLELLSVHHMYINKMANHVPPALDALGENFNEMSANCDNLNDRLELLELSVETNNNSNNNSTINDTLNDNVNKLAEQHSLITSLSNSIEELQSNLIGLTSLINQKENDINKLKQDFFKNNESFISEIETLKQTISDLQNHSVPMETDEVDVVADEDEVQNEEGEGEGEEGEGEE